MMGTRFRFGAAALILGGLLAPAFPEEESSSSKKSGITGMPIVYYTPETRWAWGGGGLVYFSVTKDVSVVRPSNIAFSAIYTQNKQYSFDLNPDFYFGRGLHFQFEL